MTSDVIRLSGVTVNAPDALQLARFYADITGGSAEGEATWARVTGPGGEIGFQQVADFRPPTWPDGEVPMHLHLDFLVDDLAATEARVLAAGATRFDTQPNDDHCLVYADPAGHPFCLTLWDGDRAAQSVGSTGDGSASTSPGVGTSRSPLSSAGSVSPLVESREPADAASPSSTSGVTSCSRVGYP